MNAITNTEISSIAETPDTDSRDYITVIQATQAIGKSATLGPDGKIEFTTDGAGITGKARTVYVPDGKTMLALLSSLKPNEFITPDFVPEALRLGVDFLVVTQARYTEMTGLAKSDPSFGQLTSVDGGKTHFIALSLTPGAWIYGSWRLFDRDIASNTPARFKCSMSDWAEMVERIVPGFSKSERVVWPSSKGRVCIAGRPDTAAQSLNVHVWVHCSNPDVSERARSSAKFAAANAGLLWHTPRISKATGEAIPGAGNPATLFDLSVFNIHRNVYACPPKVGEGLELLPPNGYVIDGGLLDMELAFPKVPAGRVEILSTEDEPAKADSRGRITITNTGALTDTTLIELEGGTTLTVEAFVSSTAYIAGEKYRCQTPFRESSSMNGIIRKTVLSTVMVHDNGTGVTFWTNLPVWRPAANAYKSARLEFIDKDGVMTAATEQVKAETELRFALALSAMPMAHRKLLAHEIKSLSGLTSVEAIKALVAIGQAAYARTNEAKINKEAQAQQRQAEDETREAQGRRELTTLTDHYDALHELQEFWWLTLNAEKVTAATFFNNPTNHNLLEMKDYSIPALRQFLAPADIPGEVGDISPVDVWMSSPKRRGVRTVTFEPGVTEMPQGTLNLWSGWGVQPAQTSKGCELFLKHLREAWAAGDLEIYHYLLGWMATVVQRIYYRQGLKPMRRTEVALVARSGQGTGKGLLGNYFGRIFGLHALATSKGDGLASRFNSNFANKLFIQADEAFFAGDHKTHDVLKSFLTDPVFDVEKKFRDAITLPNYASLLMTSNKDWVTPADVDDRRMCVFDVSDLHKGDRAYFKALADELENGGPEALFRYLIDMDLSDFDVTDFPRTAALGEQVENTIGRDEGVFGWVADALEAGEFTVPAPWERQQISTGGMHVHVEYSNLNPVMPWPNNKPLALPIQVLTGCVADFCRGRRFTSVSSKSIGKQLVKAGLVDGVERKGYLRDDRSIYRNTPMRVRFWYLPPLAEAREIFAAYLVRSGRQSGGQNK